MSIDLSTSSRARTASAAGQVGRPGQPGPGVIGLSTIYISLYVYIYIYMSIDLSTCSHRHRLKGSEVHRLCKPVQGASQPESI